MAKKIVAGNWKMNKNLQEGIELAAIENLTNQRTSAIVRQMIEIDKTVERLVEKRTAYFKAI